ncbi:MAG: efflux RND transporter permease subunit, partial [Pseudomonadota bacterium]
ISISNIVMFGLILSVGMLVDGAIVVVEYADKRQQEGVGPMASYVEAAKRMFWPVVSSTATTLCAFLPMLFWPGVPGEFMGMLPVTLIFVLSASLIVALVYLPVMGGVLGRLIHVFSVAVTSIQRLPVLAHLALFPLAVVLVAASLGIPPLQGQVGAAFAAMDQQNVFGSVLPTFAQVFLLAVGMVALLCSTVAGAGLAVLSAIALITRFFGGITGALRRVIGHRAGRVRAGYQRSAFGYVIKGIVGNPIMPLVMIGVVFVFVGTTLIYFMNNNRGVEFFVETEPEQAIVYVMARGNMSLEEKDALLQQAEAIVNAHPGIDSVFAFAGSGGLNANTGGAQSPKDTIGQIQLETIPWEDRPDATEPWFTLPFVDYTVMREVKAQDFDGDTVMDELADQLGQIPGIRTEILNLSRGPASGKPVHLRIKGDNWQDLLDATSTARQKFEATPGLIKIEDTRPLPGIDWQIDVDVQKAGRYGADVATVGAMVQLVTRGLLLDTMRVDTSDEEIEIRVRLPEEDRVLSTLDTLKVRTADGLVPLANFITRTPVAELAQIIRLDVEIAVLIHAVDL